MTTHVPVPRVDPIRSAASMTPNRRDVLQLERTRLLEQLDEVDTQIGTLSTRRAQLVERLADLRDRLWPVALHRRGRRPGTLGENDLPPVVASPTWLSGRRLRSVCLCLLRRAVRLTLRQLHALLHAHGYGIDSAHAVKTLSDALAYEVECGRARRVGRGEYQIHGTKPRAGRHGAPALQDPAPTVADRLLDEVLAPTG